MLWSDARLLEIKVVQSSYENHLRSALPEHHTLLDTLTICYHSKLHAL